jgi:hypothetical protein
MMCTDRSSTTPGLAACVTKRAALRLGGALLLALALLRPVAVAQEQNVWNVGFTSYSTNQSCSSTVDLPEGAVSMADYSCDSLDMPSAWNLSPDDQVYDLVVVGGGASGVYMVNRLVEEFKRQGQPVPKIAMVERTNDIGGRLMSARGSGGLGLAVRGLDAETTDIPPEEYGGMRIDPYRYRLVFDKIIEEGQALYGKDKCLSVADCMEDSVNCCPDLLFRMEVGNIRYGASPGQKSLEILGPLLGNASLSNLDVPSQTYVVEDIGNGDFKSVQINVTEAVAAGVGSPYDKCKQLISLAGALVDSDSSLKDATWKVVIDKVCSSSNQATKALCEAFPGDTKYFAPISCSGYDNFNGTTAPYAAVSGLTNEVTNEDLGTHLYVLKMGTQRFLQGLMYVNGTITVSPMYGKELVAVEVDGESPTADAEAQIGRIDVNTPLEGFDTAASASGSTEVLTLKFSDGSSIRAKNAFLTMLPFDLPRIGGFEPWEKTIEESLSPSMAVKLVMGWENPEDAPPARLGLKSCAGDGTCQRVIMDGPASEGWMVRQLWMWGPKTVMVYNVAGDPTKQEFTAAKNMIQLGTEEGMDALVKTVMEQINLVANLSEPIVTPTWARIKPWPAGSITGWRNAAEGANIATYLERPLGTDVPVFYGNSEAAPDTLEHGWIQGGWNMVEDSLPALAKRLGLKEDLPRYDPPAYEMPSPTVRPLSVLDENSQKDVSALGSAAPSTAFTLTAMSSMCALLLFAL